MPDMNSAGVGTTVMLEAIEYKKSATMAAPWSSKGKGETWALGDFFATFQTRPATLMEDLAMMAGVPPEPSPMTYLYAMTVFYRRDRNPSARPVISLGLEQADYDVAASMGLPMVPGTPNSGKGPVVLGMFTAQGHVNFGEYDGSLDRSAIRDRFLHIVTQKLMLSGSPTLIGTIADAYGHPMLLAEARPRPVGLWWQEFVSAAESRVPQAEKYATERLATDARDDKPLRARISFSARSDKPSVTVSISVVTGTGDCEVEIQKICNHQCYAR
jgi:hypothetical protein